MAFDAWGGSWGTSWGLSWTRGTAPVPPVVQQPSGGWDVYLRSPYKKKHAEDKAELERLDKEIALAEERRIEALEAQRQRIAIREQIALEALLQDEINVLRMERVRLIRQIEDEEVSLALLLTLPLH
jgi:hypothetical protein